MAKDMKGKRASVWHAYTALREQGKDKENAVAKGQLKVLTHNLATRVGLTDVEKQLDERFDSVSNIEFDDYAGFLADALFSRLQVVDGGGTVDSVQWDALDDVDDVCWLVCAKMYCAAQERLLSAGDVYKLWRIFNSLAETMDDVGDCDEASVPVTVHAEEVQLFVQRLGVVLRTAASYDAEGLPSCFADFLRAIETSCVAGKNASVVSSAVGELYDEIIANVLKKGYLHRRGGHGVTPSSERAWYVLTPTRLRVYSGRDEKDQKTELAVSKACQVEDLPDKAGLALGSINIGIGVKMNRFTIRFTDGSSSPIELYADDAHTKSEWIQAFRTAIESGGSVVWSPYGVEVRKRRAARAQQQARERDEIQRKKDEDEMMQRTLKELEEQRQAREEAERRCREDGQRIAELQELHRGLEELLEVERQAKRDEELVRSLQTTVLQEEFKKREELEELKASLEQLLQQEQMKSSELEAMKQEQEKMLTDEQERLEKLQQERQKRDREYEIAVAKLSDAERAKEEMERELKRKAQELEKRTGARFQASRLAGGADITRMSVSHRGLGAFSRAEMTWRRRADEETVTSQPTNVQTQLHSDQLEQVPVEHDTAAASDVGYPVCPPSQTDDSSPPPASASDEAGTVQSSVDNVELVDVGCPACPPSQMDDSRPPPASGDAGTVQSSADNVELVVDGDQSCDERKANCYDDDAQQLQPTPPLGAGNTEQQLISASTS